MLLERKAVRWEVLRTSPLFRPSLAPLSPLSRPSLSPLSPLSLPSLSPLSPLSRPSPKERAWRPRGLSAGSSGALLSSPLPSRGFLRPVFPLLPGLEDTGLLLRDGGPVAPECPILRKRRRLGEVSALANALSVHRGTAVLINHKWTRCVFHTKEMLMNLIL